MNRFTPVFTTRSIWQAGCAAVLLAAGTPAALAQDSAPTIVAEQQIERLSVRDVQLDRQGVRALVVNHSDQRLEDVTLRVTYQWRWADEFHPGEDSPGFSDTVCLDGALAPGESRELRYAPPHGLPDRHDGQFAPAVSVVSFTAYDGNGNPQASR